MRQSGLCNRSDRCRSIYFSSLCHPARENWSARAIAIVNPPSFDRGSVDRLTGMEARVWASGCSDADIPDRLWVCDRATRIQQYKAQRTIEKLSIKSSQSKLIWQNIRIFRGHLSIELE